MNRCVTYEFLSMFDTTWPIVVNQIELNKTAREEIQPTEMEEAQPLNET